MFIVRGPLNFAHDYTGKEYFNVFTIFNFFENSIGAETRMLHYEITDYNYCVLFDTEAFGKVQKNNLCNISSPSSLLLLNLQLILHYIFLLFTVLG